MHCSIKADSGSGLRDYKEIVALSKWRVKSAGTDKGAIFVVQDVHQ